jgi:hypothetical protein
MRLPSFPGDALTVAGAIATGVRGIVGAVAAVLTEALGGRADDEATVRLLRRGRVLVAQATSRLLLHELGLALAEPSGSPAGPKVAGLAGRLSTGRGVPSSDARSPHRAGRPPDGE